MLKNSFVVSEVSTKNKISSHAIGNKVVLFTGEVFKSSITQIAIGKLNASEIIPSHLHETMDEVFFILSGTGIFNIADNQFTVLPNCCIRVPSGIVHSIKAITGLRFYYFGVATN